MEIQSSLSSGINAAREKADFDAVCKRLLSEKIILAWIMKSCLTEYRDTDIREIAGTCIEGPPYDLIHWLSFA